MLKVDVFLLVLVFLLPVRGQLQPRSHRQVVSNAAMTQALESDTPACCFPAAPKLSPLSKNCLLLCPEMKDSQVDIVLLLNSLRHQFALLLGQDKRFVGNVTQHLTLFLSAHENLEWSIDNPVPTENFTCGEKNQKVGGEA